MDHLERPRTGALARRTRRPRARWASCTLIGLLTAAAGPIASAQAEQTIWVSPPYQAGLTNPGDVYDPVTLTTIGTDASAPVLSGDGTTAVFGISQASPFFVGPPAGRAEHVLRYDLRTHTSEVISRADGADGALDPDYPANASLYLPPSPAISSDARSVWVANSWYGAPVEQVDRLRVGDDNVRVQLDNSEPPRAFGSALAVSGNGRSVLLGGNGGIRAPFPQVDGFTWQSGSASVDELRSSLFVRDLQTGRTRAAVVGSDGELPNASITNASISDDGRYVVFTSRATNLVEGQGTAATRIYRVDLQAGGGPRTEVVSAGTPATTTINAGQLALAGDGRSISFASSDALTGVATGGKTQIYRVDLETGETLLVSRSASGAAGADTSSISRISADGRWIAYQTAARNIVALDHPQLSAVLLWDARTGTSERVVLTPAGEDPANDYVSGSLAGPRSEVGDVSDDGRFVAYRSDAPGLVAGNPDAAPGNLYAYVRDRASVPSAGAADATGVTASGATVGATISVPGPSDTTFQATRVRVEYGTSAEYGASLDVDGTIGGGDEAPVEATLTGLAPGTSYHYRVVATNAAGTVSTDDRTFTTEGAGVTRQVGVSGTVAAALGLVLDSGASLGTFLPGVAADYDATLTGTVTATGPATLTVADEGSEPGFLLNSGAPLAAPLRVCAATPACSHTPLGATPLTLASFGAGVSPVTIGLRQAISAGEALVPGTYGKTLTFTLAAGTP